VAERHGGKEHVGVYDVLDTFQLVRVSSPNFLNVALPVPALSSIAFSLAYDRRARHFLVTILQMDRSVGQPAGRKSDDMQSQLDLLTITVFAPHSLPHRSSHYTFLTGVVNVLLCLVLRRPRPGHQNCGLGAWRQIYRHRRVGRESQGDRKRGVEMHLGDGLGD
jgi:hypothetical protein